MGKTIAAIVGRPNVGKSTLFNKIAGERISIVEDTPGVTRDRIYYDTTWNGKTITLIDTGGIEPKTDDVILEKMRTQAKIAIETADVIVFMVDVHAGLTADDKEIGTMLIVAHRLSTVQHADNIIVMSHGEIIEQGTHSALLAKKGRYYDLYTLQLKKQQIEA